MADDLAKAKREAVTGMYRKLKEYSAALDAAGHAHGYAAGFKAGFQQAIADQQAILKEIARG